MVKLLLFVPLVFLFISGCSSLGTNTSFELKKYKEVKWENGLNVLLIPDKTLPYISLKMLVDAGSRRDPLAKSGLAQFVADLLNKGTSNRSAEQIADDLSEKAISFSTSVGADFAMVEADSLSMNSGALIDNFTELLTLPSFQNKEIYRHKKIVVQNLMNLVDDPDSLVSVAFFEKLYGDHPYGKRSSGQVRDVKSFKRKDLLKFYRKYYSPNNATLAIIGDYNEEFVAQLKSKLSSWSQRKIEPFQYPQLSEQKGLQIELITKPDLSQTQILMGHLSIDRKSKDFHSLRAANMVLGGAFFSRLSNEIRKKQGLTYSIYSFVDPRKDKGPFAISTFTKHETAGKIIEEALKVVQEFKEKGINETELKESKALLMGRFPRALETPERLADNLLYLRFYGISDDYLTGYLKKVNELSLSEVNDAIKENIFPENFKIIVYAPNQPVLNQLRPIGVTSVKNYKDFL